MKAKFDRGVIKARALGIDAKLAAMVVNSNDVEAIKALDQHIRSWLGTTKRDIIRAHPELSAREIRKRYGISVNHVRVERANNFTKRKAKP